MSSRTKEDILSMAEENNVKFIRLQFSDILGIVKNVAITREQLPVALEKGIMFDGSSIDGFARIQESDMYLRPDPDTFCLFPWRPKENGSVARLICDVYCPDGTPFAGDPRQVLKKVLKEARELGYSMQVGPEPEFFLFENDEEGNPTVIPQDKGGYFDLSPMDQAQDTRRNIILALEKMGFEVETSHHEVAPGQHEIDFKYADALRTADNIGTFKFVTKTMASEQNLHATFMPKPIAGENGSGMHIHQSLCSNGENVFYDPDDRLCLSKTAYYYIGGLLKHARAFTAITNPTINSYKRLVPGYEAPVYVSWSSANRSALIRIPSADGDGSRLELRNPDPSANPYLAIAVMLKAGLDGIKNEIEAPPEVVKDIYHLSKTEKKELGITSLPGNIMEAVRLMLEDEVIKETLGNHILNKFVQAKQTKWQDYRSQVHRWELENYLEIY